jgi:hypothetical protein
MSVQRTLTCLGCALALAFTSAASGADAAPQNKHVKPAAKTASKKTHKAGVKAAPRTLTKAALKPAHVRKSRAAPALRGRAETLTCRNGTEDRHARIGVVLIGGKVDSFAYYSKWKPRTCSIYLQRNRDAYSHWKDSGDVTNVTLERGSFTIEQHKGEYRFVFHDVDRERYCGMDGTINGSLTIRKGSERCELAGVMEEGVPLGQAYANAAQPAATGATGYGAGPAAVYNYGTGPETPPAKRQMAQRPSPPTSSSFPAATSGLSD